MYGGDINKEKFDNDDRFKYYYPYAFLFRNWVIPNLIINGNQCNGNKTEIRKLSAGANGMTLAFRCENSVQYTVKFNFNLGSVYNVENNETWINYIEKTVKEFSNIKKFDSPYIMKAYKYFIFDVERKKFIFKIYPNSTDSEIILCDDFIYNPNYKFSNISDDVQVIDKIPKFAGIILEYIPNQFTNLSKDLSYNNIVKLFKEYLLGIKKNNDEGYIHNDIKEENMMYSLIDSNYSAKIVDLGEIFNIRSINKFSSASIYHANQDLINIAIANTPANSDDTKLTTLFNQVLFKYDLYCLADVFKNFGFVNLTPNTPLHKILDRRLSPEFKNGTVLGLLG